MFGILNKLKRPKRPSVPSDVTVPADTRVYAIGDIHGRVDLLDTLHAKIRADAQEAQAARNVIVYLGDYVDRGLDSRSVIDRLIDPPLPEFERVYLKGNHEAIMLNFLSDSTIGKKWMVIGGNSTLFSYGIELPMGPATPDRFEEIKDHLARKLPPEHFAFLQGLTLCHTVGNYHFVHAGIRPGRSLSEQVERDLIWIREPFLSSPDWHGKMIVHGHSTERQPEVFENRIGIDTAAYASGRLTCLVLWDEERAFLFAEA